MSITLRQQYGVFGVYMQHSKFSFLHDPGCFTLQAMISNICSGSNDYRGANFNVFSSFTSTHDAIQSDYVMIQSFIFLLLWTVTPFILFFRDYLPEVFASGSLSRGHTFVGRAKDGEWLCTSGWVAVALCICAGKKGRDVYERAWVDERENENFVRSKIKMWVELLRIGRARSKRKNANADQMR
ncbi:hypothetical protein EYC80_000462 [Monilinia laxa]|uniref:Uncharacterized protein n=1 Tax=Monilinia laxa TaxID=61186 RepID=A0A5N6KAN0_MONLA|nr:hypothetical protein EYC80_000462 [Monilinia laxa]